MKTGSLQAFSLWLGRVVEFEINRPAELYKERQNMNRRYLEHVERMPDLFDLLMSAPRYPMKPKSEWRKISAIYIIWIDGKAAHVGRTRNLQGRVQGHTSNSHYSASFAFKQARRSLNKVATYTPENSRKALFEQEDFYAEFSRHRTILQNSEVSFLEVPEPVDQYLLELYAALELGMDLDEFDTH